MIDSSCSPESWRRKKAQPLLKLNYKIISESLHRSIPQQSVFGSYAVHKDPKSEADLVCQSVSMFEDEMTRDRSPRAYK